MVSDNMKIIAKGRSHRAYIFTLEILGCLLAYHVSVVHHAGAMAKEATNQPVPDVKGGVFPFDCAMFRKGDPHRFQLFIVQNLTSHFCHDQRKLASTWVPTFMRLLVYTLPLFIVYLIVSEDMIMGRDERVIQFILVEVTRLKG